jgi:hypothetical protein
VISRRWKRYFLWFFLLFGCVLGVIADDYSSLYDRASALMMASSVGLIVTAPEKRR